MTGRAWGSRVSIHNLLENLRTQYQENNLQRPNCRTAFFILLGVRVESIKKCFTTLWEFLVRISLKVFKFFRMELNPVPKCSTSEMGKLSKLKSFQWSTFPTNLAKPCALIFWEVWTFGWLPWGVSSVCGRPSRCAVLIQCRCNLDFPRSKHLTLAVVPIYDWRQHQSGFGITQKVLLTL